MGQPSGRQLAGVRRVTVSGGRLARTAVQLRPGQVTARARLRAQRITLGRELPLTRRWLLSGPDPNSAVGWPTSFEPLDARVRTSDSDLEDGGLRGGEISLLGQTRRLAPADAAGAADWAAADWEAAGAPLLWRFHLHYWDWAWILVTQHRAVENRALFTAAWGSWQSRVTPGRGTAWSSYPASLRAWSFCGLYRPLAAGTAVEREFLAQLALHAGFLRRHLETDVGGNHLIKNLKALAGLAVFFGDERLLTRTLTRLRRQLAVQVLPDGGHYERSPAYHCQVLGDLLDLAGLLHAAGRGAPPELAEAITAMRRWLGAVLTPAGDIPLLNDGFPVSSATLAALGPAAPPGGPLHLLPDTGLARATAGRWHLLADVGLPCPRELPAHAHADSLTCLVHVDGEPLFIDTATSTYAPGQLRDAERGTAAHNTVEVDGRDSTEVWGAFRAGRRARVHGLSTDADAATITVTAAHDGYRNLPGRPRHQRQWTLRDGELRVDDTVTGRGRHRLAVHWHLAPDIQLRLTPDGAVVTAKTGDLEVTVSAAGGRPELTAGTAEVASGFGRRTEAPVLTCVLRAELPVRISTAWRLAAAYPNSEQEPV